MKHYVAMDEQEVTDTFFEQMSGKLGSKPKKGQGAAE